MDSFNSHIEDIIEQSKNRILQNGWQGLVEERIKKEHLLTGAEDPDARDH